MTTDKKIQTTESLTTFSLTEFTGRGDFVYFKEVQAEGTIQDVKVHGMILDYTGVVQFDNGLGVIVSSEALVIYTDEQGNEVSSIRLPDPQSVFTSIRLLQDNFGMLVFQECIQKALHGIVSAC